MFFRVNLWLIFFAAFLCACDSPRNADKPTPPPSAIAYDFTTLDKILERVAPKHGGIALVLVKDDKVIYRKSFGSHSPETVVPIASASKWLSGALMMTLVDEGNLSLDDPVSKYLREFSGDKASITIRQLFAHTSGLPSETRCRNDKKSSLERCASEIARLPLSAAPGEEFFYAGVSMHVGGRVAEVITGKSFNDLFVDRIASPLGMTKTDFFAYGPTSNPRPAGDARSSADDYAKFLQMLLREGNFNGREILSPRAVAELHGDQTRGARIEYTIYEKHRDLDPNLPLARYGVGVWRELASNQQLQDLSSQGALGFTPWIDVERKLGGVISVRSSFSRVMPDYLELKNEIRRLIDTR